MFSKLCRASGRNSAKAELISGCRCLDAGHEESGKDTIAAVIEGGIYIYEIYILEYRLA